MWVPNHSHEHYPLYLREDTQGKYFGPIFGDLSKNEKLSEIKPPLMSPLTQLKGWENISNDSHSQYCEWLLLATFRAATVDFWQAVTVQWWLHHRLAIIAAASLLCCHSHLLWLVVYDRNLKFALNFWPIPKLTETIKSWKVLYFFMSCQLPKHFSVYH